MTATARRGGLLAALLLGAAGIAFFFRIELASGFATVKGPHVDDRQVHWVLEWSALCLRGDPRCVDRWSAPYFFPTRGNLAYGDPMPGLGLLYGGLRWAGAPPVGAFAATQMLLLGLGFAAALWMLAGPLRLPAATAAIGAYLFALGAPVAGQADHPHLFARFALPLLFGALLRLLEETEPRRRRVWWALAACAWTLQAWTNLNLLWLASFVVVCLAVAALALPATRGLLAASARADVGPALVSAALAAAAVYPLLRRMIEAQRLVGGARVASQWYEFAPQPESWINVGAHNWIWGSLTAWPPIRDLHFPWEHELGIGLVTSGACLAGVWLSRRRPPLRALFLASGLAGLLVMRWPGGFTLWTAVHAFWPGAESVRALGRLSLVLLAPAAIALALALEHLLTAQRRAAWALLAGVVLLEQQRGFDKASVAAVETRVAQVAAMVPDDCSVFFWSPRTWGMDLSPEATQLDAMWAALRLGKPTVNGWASYVPPGWSGLHDHGIPAPPRRMQLRDHLSFWALHSGVPRGEICWILGRLGPAGLEPAGMERIDPARSPWPANGARPSGARP